jgi:hypothetical protein
MRYLKLGVNGWLSAFVGVYAASAKRPGLGVDGATLTVNVRVSSGQLESGVTSTRSCEMSARKSAA